jgi:hypothetical protein
MTGHSQSQLLQMHIVDLLAPSSLAVLPSHLLALRSSASFAEWELNRVDGGVVVAELTTVRMQDGRYMAFGRDLTEKKRPSVPVVARAATGTGD